MGILIILLALAADHAETIECPPVRIIKPCEKFDDLTLLEFDNSLSVETLPMPAEVTQTLPAPPVCRPRQEVGTYG